MINLKFRSKVTFALSLIIILSVALGTWYYRSQQNSTESTDAVIETPKPQGKNIKALNYSQLKIKTAANIYQPKIQKKLHHQVQALEKKKNYSFNHMLILANPYLTDTTSLYLHFKTKQPVKISYRVKSGKKISTFKRTLYNPNGTYAKKHSYQLIGLIGGHKNQITITATTKAGTKTTKTFTYHAPQLVGKEANRLKVKNGSSTQKLTSGLYAFIGDKNLTQRATYLVDNDGYIRGEIPLIGYNSLRLVQRGNYLYFAVNNDQIVKMDRLGRIIKSYSTKKSGYEIHHDFAVDSSGNLISLATSLQAKKREKRVEDQIIKISGQTGKVTRLLDFKKLMPALYKKATSLETETSNKGYHDVIHANTIQLLNDNQILISSRETSTIMKISDLETKPKLDYLIADSSVWQGIDNYSNLLLKKETNFVSQAGQHSVTYTPTSQKGIYYLEMLNNNSAIMNSRPSFKWTNYPGTGKSSYYYKYLVNENTGSYKLVSKIAVPYSPFIGSVQAKNQHVIIDSGMTGTVFEYDANGKLIRSFTTTGKTKFLYRVYKYDFDHFYFHG